MKQLVRIWQRSDGQALVEFSLVIFLLVLMLFSILEGGLILNAKTVLTSSARETARVCAVEGGRSAGAIERLNESLAAGGIKAENVTAVITPAQAIYGTTIRVELVYEYKVVSPVVRAIVGASIPLSSKAVTRSEFAPDSVKRRGRSRPGLRSLLALQDGAVLALVALFLPVAVLTVGMVLDLGTVYFAKRAVQAACDLGALAGVIEIDWDALAKGDVRIDPTMGEAKAVQVAGENVYALGSVIRDVFIATQVLNDPAREEPTVQVECRFKVRAHFLGFLPGLGSGIPCAASSEASVVKRTKW